MSVQTTAQKKSAASMARRNTDADVNDDYPTPPWATRALIKYGNSFYDQIFKLDGYRRSQRVVPLFDTMWSDERPVADLTCLEPASGRGFMARELRQVFGSVDEMDIHSYGRDDITVDDFLNQDAIDENGEPTKTHDWIITNPPFSSAGAFIREALDRARLGVAILGRIQLLESVDRYPIWRDHPPTLVLPFAERLSFVQGAVDAKARGAAAHAWFVWCKHVRPLDGRRVWVIPSCKRELERADDGK